MDLHKVVVSAGRPAAPRRVGPPGPHARRAMRLGAAPRSGAALIQYGLIRQRIGTRQSGLDSTSGFRRSALPADVPLLRHYRPPLPLPTNEHSAGAQHVEVAVNWA